MKKMIFEVFVCMLLIATVVPVTRGAANWTEEQKLRSSDIESKDWFGCSVSLSGDTALIGAKYNDDKGTRSGSAYVFTRTGTTWTQQAKLLASNGVEEDQFGCSVSLDGDTALIGASEYYLYNGSAYVFTRSGTTWTQQAKLLASDGLASSHFGYSVSLSGDTALIGAMDDNDNGANSGSAYVFTRTGTTWTQQAKLLPSDGKVADWFGRSVSLSGNTALIATSRSSTYVFTRTGTTWSQQQKLDFGYLASLNDDTALIFDSNSYDSGAYVFTRSGTTWTQQQRLRPLDNAQNFGSSISLYGDIALIGAYWDKGSAYVFTRSGTSWTQQYKLLASDGVGGDHFGESVSIFSNTVLISAPATDGYLYARNGSAYVFTTGGENQPPVAGFTWTPSNPTPNQTITFNASTSSDPDGSITKYEWDWNNDGTYEGSLVTPTATHSWTQAGNYPVTLRVTDNGGATNTKTITIPVSSSGGGGTNNKGTPGFELVVVIGAIAVAMLFYRKKRIV
jgi:hypothetical protein